MRIYPPHLAPIQMEPQAEDFCVIDVDDACGQGVVVLRSFRKGERMFRMNGVPTKTLTLHTLQLAPGLHLDDPFFAGKVLHSCAPNSLFDVNSRLFIATRAIEAGELLTMDYEETEDELFRPFTCCCGEKNCRGKITGRVKPLLVPQVPAESNHADEFLVRLPSRDSFSDCESTGSPKNIA